MADREPLVYLNGRFLPRSRATLDIEDRGAMFADGVYEVLRYYHGRAFAAHAHLDRLRQSLQALHIMAVAPTDRLITISDELVRANHLTDATVYWQVTRGSAPRHHAFPPRIEPTVLAIAYPAEPVSPDAPPAPKRMTLAKDLRWHRCSIKSLMLLPNVLAKNQALASGYDDAILHRQGRVTESTSASVMIVRDGQLWTHPADQWVLGGITRQTLLDLAGRHGLDTAERAFNTDQLLTADEVLVCGTTTHVASVLQVDSHTIGSGCVGPITVQLQHGLLQEVLRQAQDT